jgi:Trk-type K+ transport system membrane component
LILIALMFVGRVGPAVLGFAVFQVPRPEPETGHAVEDVAL